MGLSATLAGLQAGLAITALATVELTPPQDGPMMLISTTGMPQGEILNLALRTGAAPLAAGPIPGSIIVRGERGPIARAAVPAGVLVLAASDILCGGRS